MWYQCLGRTTEKESSIIVSWLAAVRAIYGLVICPFRPTTESTLASKWNQYRGPTRIVTDSTSHRNLTPSTPGSRDAALCLLGFSHRYFLRFSRVECRPSSFTRLPFLSNLIWVVRHGRCYVPRELCHGIAFFHISVELLLLSHFAIYQTLA